MYPSTYSPHLLNAYTYTHWITLLTNFTSQEAIKAIKVTLIRSSPICVWSFPLVLSFPFFPFLAHHALVSSQVNCITLPFNLHINPSFPSISFHFLSIPGGRYSRGKVSHHRPLIDPPPPTATGELYPCCCCPCPPNPIPIEVPCSISCTMPPSISITSHTSRHSESVQWPLLAGYLLSPPGYPSMPYCSYSLLPKPGPEPVEPAPATGHPLTSRQISWSTASTCSCFSTARC